MSARDVNFTACSYGMAYVSKPASGSRSVRVALRVQVVLQVCVKLHMQVIDSTGNLINYNFFHHNMVS